MSPFGSDQPSPQPSWVVGRYVLYSEIAAGGMATVHLGRLLGPVGFTRTVAIKRLHPHLAKDPEFATMFLDEARLAARVRHPNVVPTVDVVAYSGELLLVMEYVHGESLSALIRAASELKQLVPLAIVVNILSGVLQGLHAAHEACSDQGEPLGIVHRDVSPQNVLVGVDGVPRLVDFGVAKAIGRLQTTREGQVKGKIGFMAPEQIRGGRVTRQTDIFSASATAWQALTGRRLFRGSNDAETIYHALHAPIDPPSRYASEIPPALDEVVLKGLARDPAKRYATANDMAVALEAALPMATQRQVAEWVLGVAKEPLLARAQRVAEVESISSNDAAQAGGAAVPAGLPLAERSPGSFTPSNSPSALAPANVPESSSESSLTAQESVGTVSTSAMLVDTAVPRRRVKAYALAGALVAVVLVVAVWLVLGRSPGSTQAPLASAPLGTSASAAAASSPAALPTESPATSSASSAPPATSGNVPDGGSVRSKGPGVRKPPVGPPPKGTPGKHIEDMYERN